MKHNGGEPDWYYDDDESEGGKNGHTVAFDRQPMLAAAVMEDRVAPGELYEGCMHPAMRGLVFEIAEKRKVDPVVPFMGCLAAVSACADNRIRLQPAPDADPQWLEPVILWLLLVGDVSVGKTPGLLRTLKAPLDAIESVWRLQDAKASQEHLLLEELARAEKAAWVKEARVARATGGVLPQIPDVPVPPRERLLHARDATVEGLAEYLSTSPEGLLVFSDEIAQILFHIDSGYNGGGAKARADYLEAYVGGAHTVLRKSSGVMRVPHWGFSVMGGVQPTVIYEHARNLSTDGFLHRFICGLASPNLDPTIARTPADSTLDEGWRAILAAICHARGAREEGIRTIPILGEALDELYAAREAINVRLLEARSTYPSLAQARGKQAGMLVRLVGAYWMLDVASGEPLGEGGGPSAACVERARLLLEQWVDPGQRHLFESSDLGLGERTPRAQIAVWLKKRPVGSRVSARDVYRGVSFYRRWKESGASGCSEAIARDMSDLILAGWVVKDEKSGWIINPFTTVE